MKQINQWINYFKFHKYRFWIALIVSPIIMFLMGLFLTFIFLWGTGTLKIESKDYNAKEVDLYVPMFESEILLPDMTLYGVQISFSNDFDRAQLSIDALKQQGIYSNAISIEGGYGLFASLSASETLSRNYKDSFILMHPAYNDAFVQELTFSFKPLKIWLPSEADREAIETQWINFYSNMGDFILKMNGVETLPYSMIEDEIKKIEEIYELIIQFDKNNDTHLTLFLQEILNEYNFLISSKADLSQFLEIYMRQIIDLSNR